MRNLYSKSTASEDRLDSMPLALKRATAKSLRFQNRDETEKGNEIWLLTLSDLLMLLMIFFVVLFGMGLNRKEPAQQPLHAGLIAQTESKAHRVAEQETTPSPSSQNADLSASLEKDLIAALNPEKGRQGVTVERIADLVLLTFPEQIVFDPGQAQLKSSAQTTLNKVASFIRERPYLIVEIQGHADDRPIHSTRYPSNWELSLDRATQVAKALMDRGIAPAQLSVKGFGEYRSLVPNDSDENRLKNRCVEIQFSIPPQS